MQQFLDNREFLQWDVIYGTFNNREDKLVGGQYVRRYWHIYPAD